MNGRFRGYVALASILTLALTLMPAVAWGVADPVEAQVTTDTRHQLAPAISGERIVWKDFRNGNYDIYLFDLGTLEEIAVTTNGSIQQNPAVSGDNVVWQDFRNGNWDIYHYDLATEVETQLTSDGSAQQNPAISGDRVVWEDYRNGNWDIYLYDIGTGLETQVTDEAARQRYVDIAGDRVVWEDNRNGNWDIYLYDVGTGLETQVTNDPADQCQPDTARGKIAWQDRRTGNWDIFLYDLATEELKQLSVDPTTQSGAHVAAGAVVWQDYRNGNWDIYLYDLATDSLKQITNDAASQWTAESDGGDIVWEDFRNGNGDVYMARLEATISRAAGDDRYGTASVGGTAWTGGADDVVIATGASYADALTASGLAGALDGALLLTAPNALPDSVRDRIVDLGATSATIVGGEAAVSAAVENALRDMGLSVTRIAGVDRYDTARRVALRMSSVLGSELSDTGLLVQGNGFADALAVAPYAYNAGMPVVLTRPNEMPSESQALVRQLGLESLVIAGGPVAVSEDVVHDLEIPCVRVSGPNRYATALAVAEYAADQGWGSWSYVGIATGADYADALAGGAVTGWNGGVLLMTESDSLIPGVRAALTDRVTGIDTVQVFGGTNAVSDTVFGAIEALW